MWSNLISGAQATYGGGETWLPRGSTGSSGIQPYVPGCGWLRQEAEPCVAAVPSLRLKRPVPPQRVVVTQRPPPPQVHGAGPRRQAQGRRQVLPVHPQVLQGSRRQPRADAAVPQPVRRQHAREPVHEHEQHHHRVHPTRGQPPRPHAAAGGDVGGGLLRPQHGAVDQLRHQPQRRRGRGVLSVGSRCCRHLPQAVDPAHHMSSHQKICVGVRV